MAEFDLSAIEGAQSPFDLSAITGKEPTAPQVPEQNFDLSEVNLGAVGSATMDAFADLVVENPAQGLGNAVLEDLNPPKPPETLRQRYAQFVTETLPNSIVPGMALVGQTVEEGINLLNNATGGAVENLAREQVEASRARQQARAEELAQEIGGNVPTQVAAQAAQSVVTTLPAIAAGFVNPLAGFGAMYLTSASAAENRALADGVNQHEARLFGRASGLIETGTEAAPLLTLLKKIPFKRKLAKFMFYDMGGELAATSLDKLASWVILDEETTGRQFVNDLAMTAAVTPLAAGAQVAGVNGVQRAMDIQQRWATINDSERMKGLQGKVQKQRKALADELVNELVNEGQMNRGAKLVWHGTPEGLSPDAGFDAEYVNSDFYDQSGNDAWGHYFSDAPAYSEAYRGGTDLTIDAEALGVDRTDPDLNVAYDRLMQQLQGEFTPESVQRAAQEIIAEDMASRPQGTTPPPSIDFLQRIATNPQIVGRSARGNLYSVALQDTEQFINWGRPLTSQRPEVQQALEDAGIALDQRTGQELYRELQAENEWSAREVSEYFDSIDVPGVVYDRQFADGPHRVYTVFSDSNPTIVEMNTARSEKLAQRLKDFQMKEALKQMQENPPELTMQQQMQGLGKAIGMSREQMHKLAEENLKFDFFRKWTMGIEQLAADQLLPDGVTPRSVAGNRVLAARNVARDWNATQGKWISEADDIVKQWDRLPVAQQKNIDVLMDEVDRVSRVRGRRLNLEEVARIAEIKNLKMDNASMLVVNSVWDHYQSAIRETAEQMEKYVDSAIADEFLREEAKAPLREKMNELLARNYAPRFHYGRFVLRAQDGDGKVLYKRNFPNRKARDAEVKEVKKQFPDARIVRDVDASAEARGRQRGFEGVPESFIESIEETLDLDPLQIEGLRAAQAQQTPAARALNRLDNADDTPGYSTNSLRNYATFMSQFSNRIAALQHGREYQGIIEGMRQLVGTELGGGEVQREKLTQITEWLANHQSYLKNPGNELSDLRAMGFLWYLGFVPKAAAINLTQIPLVSLPYLAAKSNDIAATKALSSAQIRFFANLAGKGKESRYSEGERMMVAELRRTILEESQAQEVGAISAGSQLMRITGGMVGSSPQARRSFNKLSEAGAFMFQKAENYNREITAVAAYDLAMKAGKSHAEGVADAREAVIRTQFEYARYNRPQLMRGKKSVFFLFMQYLTSMMWTFFGNSPPGMVWRMLGAMLFAGGLQGLPGAENIADLIDGALTKIGKNAGWKNPKVQVREQLRNYAEDLFENPDLGLQGAANMMGLSPQEAARYLMKGMGSDVFGMDVSGSLSLGRVIPGTDLFSREIDAERAIAEGVRQAGGAFINIPYGVLQAAFSENMDTWRTLEKAAPTSVRNASRAIRWAMRGKETDNSLRTVAELDPTSDWDIIAKQTMGFAPSALNARQERLFEFYDKKGFYDGYRRSAMAAYYKAYVFEESREPAMRLIRQYNAQVPWPEMKISPSDLRRSILQRAKESQYRDAGTVREKRYRRMYDEVLGPFDTPLDFSDSQ